MNDAATWILSGIGLLTALACTVVWAYSTFQTKKEAEASQEKADKRHDALQAWVTRQDSTLQRVAQDVSYIRGRMESPGVA